MNYQYIEKLQSACAFIPCYVQGIGKATKVFYRDGREEYINYSVDKTMSDYCAINLKSLNSIKIMCRSITGRKSLTPLYVEKDAIFIPVKTIKPVYRGDKCIGYVNINFIEDMDLSKGVLKLEGGQSVYYLESSETIKKRIADCTIINKIFSQNSIKKASM